MGSFIEAPDDDFDSEFEILPTPDLIAAGMSYPDQSGAVTSSAGKAASLVDSTTRLLRSRELQAGPIVDILVIVTNRGMCRAASLPDGCAFTDANRKPVEDKIVLANQQTNSAVQGVGITMSFRIVGVVHLLPSFDANPDVAALDVLKTDSNVRTWMDETGADLVAMLTGSIPSGFAAAGIAYLDRPESVTSVDYLSTYTFTHELGHNFGGRHDRLNCENSHPYALAIQVPNQFRTVMAYQCSFGVSCPTIPFFSTPRYVFNGIAMGDATRDNARKIQEAAPIVAAWRTATAPVPVPVPVPRPVPVPVPRPAPVPVPRPVPVPVPRPVPVPVPRPVPVPVPVPGSVPIPVPTTTVDPNTLWCGIVTPECPNTNLMRRRRFFSCTERCVSNLEASRFRLFGRWTCGGC